MGKKGKIITVDRRPLYEVEYYADGMSQFVRVHSAMTMIDIADRFNSRGRKVIRVRPVMNAGRRSLPGYRTQLVFK